VAIGREAIEKYCEGVFKQVQLSNNLAPVDDDSPHIIRTAGKEMWATGKYSLVSKLQDKESFAERFSLRIESEALGDARGKRSERNIRQAFREALVAWRRRALLVASQSPKSKSHLALAASTLSGEFLQRDLPTSKV